MVYLELYNHRVTQSKIHRVTRSLYLKTLCNSVKKTPFTLWLNCTQLKQVK